MNDLEAILFDLENTLINYIDFKKETAKAAANEMVEQGLPTDELTAYSKIFSIYDEHSLDYQRTFHDVVKEFDLDKNKFERIKQAAIIAYLKKKFKILDTYPTVKPTIAKLKKSYKLGIVNNKRLDKTWQRLILVNLEREFDDVVNDLNFEQTTDYMDVENEECVYVSEKIENLKEAKECGISVCWAKYGVLKSKKDVETIEKEKGVEIDFSIDKFNELLGVVNG